MKIRFCGYYLNCSDCVAVNCNMSSEVRLFLQIVYQILSMFWVFITLYIYTGLLREEQGQLEEAILCHKNTLALDDTHVDSKVKLGALLWQVNGTSYIPASKSYLAKALESEPTHSEAWYNMGLLQKTEGRKHEAAASFQAALLYEQSSPVEKFTSITPALLW